MLKVHDPAIAEDLVQETLMKAIKSFGKFRGESSLRTWLATILRNEIFGHFRVVAKESKLQSALKESVENSLTTLLNPKISSAEFDDAVENQEFWAMIQECFSRLPEHLLETFMAKWQNDETNTEEICKDLKISPSNFSVRMFRTRLMLRKCVEATWFEEPLN